MKLGGFYLQGVVDFPRNIKLALEYLSAPGLRGNMEVSILICSHLDLLEMIEYAQLEHLHRAAAQHKAARIQLMALLIIRQELPQLGHWLERNDAHACAEMRALLSARPDVDWGQALCKIAQRHGIAFMEILAAEAQAALHQGNYALAEERLSLVPAQAQSIPGAIHELIARMAALAQERGQRLHKIAFPLIEASLEHCAAASNRNACYLFGRMLAGLETGFVGAADAARATNLRKATALLLKATALLLKATALLLKAADNGRAQAWMDLFYLCSDYRSSVGNPTMARFFLEKAAASGIAEAKRRLGALILKKARGIEQMEQGVSLLYESSIHGDRLASGIIKTLVLQVPSCEQEADSGIEEVQQIAPLLATRLRLARHFGLTKLEALSINPATAIRPWGLVVEKNPHVRKGKLSEPRAVPAATRKAIETIRDAAREFAPHGEIAEVLEGSLRARALKQRRIFQKVKLQDSLFSRRPTRPSAMPCASARAGPSSKSSSSTRRCASAPASAAYFTAAIASSVFCPNLVANCL